MKCGTAQLDFLRHSLISPSSPSPVAKNDDPSTTPNAWHPDALASSESYPFMFEPPPTHATARNLQRDERKHSRSAKHIVFSESEWIDSIGCLSEIHTHFLKVTPSVLLRICDLSMRCTTHNRNKSSQLPNLIGQRNQPHYCTGRGLQCQASCAVPVQHHRGSSDSSRLDAAHQIQVTCSKIPLVIIFDYRTVNLTEDDAIGLLTI